MSEPNNGYIDFIIPEELLITDFSDLIDVIVSITYLDLLQNYIDSHFL